MHTFELTEEQIAIQDLARKMAATWAEPNVRWDRDCTFDREAIARPCREAGFTGMVIPEAYGGAASSYMDFILVFEQFAMVSYAAAMFMLSTCSGPIDFILKFGSDAIKKKYLPKLVTGEFLCGMAISEPNAGSDIGAMTTRARIEGDKVRINGNKVWVGGGGEWELYVALVRMSDAPGVAGLGSVLIEKDAPGLKFGPKFKLMGTRPVPRSEMIFDDCIIPVENILTEPGSFSRMIEVFNGERIHNACLGLGIAQGAFDHAARHARDRVQFKKRLVDFQGIQWKLADMETRLEACRLMVYRAARAKDAGVPLGVIVSQAKLFAASVCPEICNQAMQIEGASGYSEGSHTERAYRDVRLVPLAAGSNEMMMNFLGGQFAR